MDVRNYLRFPLDCASNLFSESLYLQFLVIAALCADSNYDFEATMTNVLSGSSIYVYADISYMLAGIHWMSFYSMIDFGYSLCMLIANKSAIHILIFRLPMRS